MCHTESQMDIWMVSKEGIIDFVSIGLNNSLKMGKDFFGTRLIPSFSVIKEYKSIHGGMIKPHIALMDTVFMIKQRVLYNRKEQ